MNSPRDSWRISGHPDAPWLTLVHPIGSSQGLWDDLVPRLAARFRVLTYDVRGHGAAAAAAGPATFDDLARDCEALWDALGITASHFAGLSLGGCIGVALARRAPQRVRSLTVACSRLVMDDAAAALWRERAALVRAQGMGPVVEGTLDRWLSPGFRGAHPAVVDGVRRTLAATSPAGFAASAEALARGHTLDDLAGLAVPVQYIAGRDDQAVPADHLARYHAHTPGARLAVVPGPHLLHVENPEGFLGTLLEFLGQAAPAR